MHDCTLITVVAVVRTRKHSYYRFSYLEAIEKWLMAADDGRKAVFAAESVGSLFAKFHILTSFKITVLVLK